MMSSILLFVGTWGKIVEINFSIKFTCIYSSILVNSNPDRFCPMTLSNVTEVVRKVNMIIYSNMNLSGGTGGTK